jgi:hypothetical protein
MLPSTFDLGARPVHHRVDGAPYQPADPVRVVMSAEQKGTLTDVSDFIGRAGFVEYLEYSCGCGQRYPDDPMIGVRFADGALQEFWREELAPLSA